MKKRVAIVSDKDEYCRSCTQALQESGSRITQPRLGVIRCLAEAKHALSPRDILDFLRRRRTSKNVDQVSIYRTLEVLLKHGLVHRVFPSGNFIACAHIDCSISLHVLTQCTTCRVTEELDIPPEMVSPMIWYLKHECHFSPGEHFFQMNGLCRKCSAEVA